jgi:glycosyltransferase involved in cell wall biosynthesis
LFDFLKYNVPMWYYRLHGESALPLFSDEELARLEREERIRRCWGYSQASAERMDLVYQALNIGAIPKGHESGSKGVSTVNGVQDNYLFMARHFHSKWSWYALGLRLLSLRNPFVELSAFSASRGKRLRGTVHKDLYRDFPQHVLPKSHSDALVSVIIPTLDRYEYLKDVLDDLERQDHTNLEVIVCDQTDDFQGALYENRRIPVKVIRQQEKALWKARISCYHASAGDYLLLFDDDSRVAEDWVTQHLRCLSYFNVHISAGVTETVVGHGLSSKDGRFHLSDVFDTGNAMVSREVFEKIGLFDRMFEKQRMGDGEFGMRAYLGGYAVVSNPYAKRIHLKAEAGGLRHFGGWDAFRPGRLFAPRPIPSVLYFCRRYFGASSALYLLMLSLPTSIIPYRHKGDKRIKWLTPLLFPFAAPVLAIQAAISWRLSNRMLEHGPLIEFPAAKNEAIADAGEGSLQTI